jgi:hypothetical protein
MDEVGMTVQTCHNETWSEVDDGEPGEHADIFVLLHAEDRGNLQMGFGVSFSFPEKVAT